MARRRRQPPVTAKGSVLLDITEDGATVAANSFLDVSVDDAQVTWRGRAEHPPVVDASPEVRRFLRRGLYVLRPEPPPRPVSPAPKPTPATKQRPPQPAHGVRCPQCAGGGLFGRGAAHDDITCDLCEGIGTVGAAKAEEWVAYDD